MRSNRSLAVISRWDGVLQKKYVDRTRVGGLLVLMGFSTKDIYAARGEGTLQSTLYNHKEYARIRRTGRHVHFFGRVNLYDWVEKIRLKYKELAKQYHPDVGGSNQEMATLNVIYDRLKVLFLKHKMEI